MGLDVKQLREHVVRPALRLVDVVVSPDAEELLIATAAHESHFTYLAQIHGPALGLWQMEPATHDDIWANYIAKRPQLIPRLDSIMMKGPGGAEQMAWNLLYAAAMCRLHYRRFPEPLPKPDDLEGIAALWKRRYNTPLGSGTIEQFKVNYQRIVGGPPMEMPQPVGDPPPSTEPPVKITDPPPPPTPDPTK